MGVTIFRPGQRLVIPGVQVYQPRVSVSANWWEVAGATCVAAYQPKGAASLAASYTNLTGNATYNAAPGVAPTWDATGGWTFNGTTQYLTTGIVPGNMEAWSCICRYSNAGGGFPIGTTAAGKIWGLQPFRAASIGYWNSVMLSVSPNLPTGIVAVAGNKGYRSGTADAGTISTTNQEYSNLIIGGLSSSEFLFLGKTQALAIYSTTLSAGDVATLTTAMNAL